MDKLVYFKDIEDLKVAKLRTYKITTFKKYLLTEKEWGTSKRRRVLHEDFIAVYSLYRHRVLERVFYVEEGYNNKQRYQFMIEVSRQLAGYPIKLVRNLQYGMFGLIRYDNSSYHEWQIVNATRFKWERYNYYYGCVNLKISYNDYVPYLLKSRHKYCAYEKIVHPKYSLFEYILRYEKHPEMEMLVKLGLEDILHNEYKLLRWSKKGYGILGIEKRDLPYLQNGISLKQLRENIEVWHKDNLSPQEAQIHLKLNKINVTYSKRLVRYLSSQNIVVNDYRDYLDMMNTLAIPKENKYLYPVNFVSSHDELLDRIESIRTEKYIKAIETQFKKYEPYIYETDKYKIIPVQFPNELIKESRKLEHCVRNYLDKVANGTTEIFFIRKKDKLKEPYYTLELNPNNEILQVRGNKNCKANEDVKDFIYKWSSKHHLKIECF